MSIRIASITGFTWAGLADTVKLMARAWGRRRSIGRLVVLDDHLLADIGITRQDLLSVLAEPLYVDPSEKLAGRAREARRARRDTALEASLDGFKSRPSTPRRAA